MAITKEIIVDKVEVVGQYNALQIKYKTNAKYLVRGNAKKGQTN